jgi:hypothetical protein
MQPSDEVEAVPKRMYDLMRTGDGEAAAQLIADGDGVIFVGTDADEWWSSTDAARAAFREQLEATGGLDIEPGDLRGYADGDIGWLTTSPPYGRPMAPSSRCG